MFAWLRPKKEVNYETELSGIQAQQLALSSHLALIKTTESSTKSRIFYYAVPTLVLLVSYALYDPSLLIAIAILLLALVARMAYGLVHSYYTRSRTRASSQLQELAVKKLALLEELKVKSGYYKTLGLVERFTPGKGRDGVEDAGENGMKNLGQAPRGQGLERNQGTPTAQRKLEGQGIPITQRKQQAQDMTISQGNQQAHDMTINQRNQQAQGTPTTQKNYHQATPQKNQLTKNKTNSRDTSNIPTTPLKQSLPDPKFTTPVRKVSKDVRRRKTQSLSVSKVGNSVIKKALSMDNMQNDSDEVECGNVRGEDENESLQPKQIPPRSTSPWFDRMLDLIIGREDEPQQKYALVCLKCHCHNGLVPLEDYYTECGILNSRGIEIDFGNEERRGMEVDLGNEDRGAMEVEYDEGNREVIHDFGIEGREFPAIGEVTESPVMKNQDEKIEVELEDPLVPEEKEEDQEVKVGHVEEKENIESSD